MAPPIEQKSSALPQYNHIDRGAAGPKRGVPVELHHPSRQNGPNCIQQEPCTSEVFMNEMPLLLDVLIGGQTHADLVHTIPEERGRGDEEDVVHPHLLVVDTCTH